MFNISSGFKRVVEIIAEPDSNVPIYSLRIVNLQNEKDYREADSTTDALFANAWLLEASCS